jgi:hypothetical protein
MESRIRDDLIRCDRCDDSRNENPTDPENESPPESRFIRCKQPMQRVRTKSNENGVEETKKDGWSKKDG